MAVVKVQGGKIEGEKGSDTKSAKGEFCQTRTLEYQVEFNTTKATIEDALAANDGTTAVPRAGGVLSVMSGTNTRSFFCSKADAARSSESPYFWKVTATGEIKSEQPTDSAKYNVNISVDGLDYTDVVTEDVVTNEAISDSAGMPFTEQITEEYADEELTLSFNCTAPDQTNIALCRKKINSDSITFAANGLNKVCAAKTLKLVKVRYSCSVPAALAAVSGVVVVWDIEYVFHYRAETWKRKVPDMGFYTASLTGGKPNKILDGDLKPVSTPRFLDGTGALLTHGVPVVKLEFDTIEAVAFATLCSGL